MAVPTRTEKTERNLLSVCSMRERRVLFYESLEIICRKAPSDKVSGPDGSHDRTEDRAQHVLHSGLRVSISFLIVALEASIVGPAAGIVSGAVTDLVSFVLFPDGAFFFGYTITAMLGELIYALFLYQKKITWQRLFLSKLLNNYLINVLLGSLWSAILYSKGYYWYLARSAVKNTILLPFEVLALAALFKLLLPVLQKRGWITKQS